MTGLRQPLRSRPGAWASHPRGQSWACGGSSIAGLRPGRAGRPRSRGPGLRPSFRSCPAGLRRSPGSCDAERSIGRHSHPWLHHHPGADGAIPGRTCPRSDGAPGMAVRTLQRALHRASVAGRETPRQPGTGRDRMLPVARGRRSDRGGAQCRPRASPAFPGPDARVAALRRPQPARRHPRRATHALRPTRLREGCIARKSASKADA